MFEEFLTYMKEQGWNIELNKVRKKHLPKVIEENYANAPSPWLDFILDVKSISNSNDTTWFLCSDDFEAQEEELFRWNEWELISLESAEGDVEWENKIKEFWKSHLPIIMSVIDGYSYYAISIRNGSIVRGEEPEFEECEIIADSFEKFLKGIINKRISI